METFRHGRWTPSLGQLTYLDVGACVGTLSSMRWVSGNLRAHMVGRRQRGRSRALRRLAGGPQPPEEASRGRSRSRALAAVRGLGGEAGQAVIEYSLLVFSMLGVAAAVGGASMMKDMIEGLSTYFASYFFCIAMPL